MISNEKTLLASSVSNNSSQKWRFVCSRIQNISSLLFLSSLDDNVLSLNTFSNSPNQKWKIHCFNDLFSDFESQNKKLAWKSNTVDKIFFKQDSCVWIENFNGKIVSQYRVLKEDFDHVVIYDVFKNIFIKIDNNTAKWGCSIDNIPYQFDTGKWIQPF